MSKGTNSIDYRITPERHAEVISTTQAAMDIISGVIARQGLHASYITDELLATIRIVNWPPHNGKMVEITTDGIGIFIAKVMVAIRRYMGGTITNIKLYKYQNEAGNGHYVYVGVAVNGLWTVTDGMTDFSVSGGLAYRDLSTVLTMWSWLYDCEIKTEVYSNEEHEKLLREVYRATSEDV